MCLDSLVASLPLISYNAIADMDDVRSVALYRPHGNSDCSTILQRRLIGYISTVTRLGIEDMMELADNKYFSALHIWTWLYFAQTCLTR